MQPNTQKKLSTSGGEDVCPGSFCLLGIQSGWRERLRIVTSVPSTTCGHKVKAGLSPYSYLPEGPSEVLTLFSKSSFWKECLFGVEGVWRWRHSRKRKCTDHKKKKQQAYQATKQWRRAPVVPRTQQHKTTKAAPAPAPPTPQETSQEIGGFDKFSYQISKWHFSNVS